MTSEHRPLSRSEWRVASGSMAEMFFLRSKNATVPQAGPIAWAFFAPRPRCMSRGYGLFLMLHTKGTRGQYPSSLIHAPKRRFPRS